RYRADSIQSGKSIPAVLQPFLWEKMEIGGELYCSRTTGSGMKQLDIAVDATMFPDSLWWKGTFNLRASVDSLLRGKAEYLVPGRRVALLATLYPIRDKRNPHEFDYKSYLAEREIYLQSTVDSILSISAGSNLFSWSALRQRVLGLIENNFSPPVQPLAKALLIGHKNELGREEKVAFSRVGLSHIMAVSGLHVGFLIAPFWMLIPWFWTLKYGKQAGLLLLIGLLVGYAGLTGFSTSVSRVALTGGLITYGKLFHKVRDSINLTAAAAVVLMIIDPGDLFEPGFQLSFTAVIVILTTMPVLLRMLPNPLRYRWYGKFAGIVLVSIVVQAGLYPLLAYHFGEFSLIGPLMNAAAVPLLGVVVSFAMLLLPVAGLSPTLGKALNTVNDWCLSGLDLLVGYAAGLEGSWIQIQLDSMLIFPIWAAGILCIASLRISALRWKMAALLLALICFSSGSRLYRALNPKPLRVTFFDVGQGDAALVETPGGKRFIIDTGRWQPGYNSARHIIIPHLRAAGIDRLEALFLSHPHADHIGGAPDLIAEIPIDTVYNSGFPYGSRLYRSYRRLAEQNSIPVRQLGAGDMVRLDPAIRLFVYGPGRTGGNADSDPNEHSLVLELIYGDTEFLFVGDAGRAQEQRLVNRYDSLLDTDLLKVGHHGSGTSSTAEFLDLVSPEIAVVSLAKSNRYRHPHPKAVARLRRSARAIYFTSLDRARIFQSDGTAIHPVEW
ncbi:MAG: DNA internalization-related competence protein ComEC/Rec2, partial [Balneolaceae bacterium]|nr:DNA internalization-related competence protein ComEC/Rec2 [Balneolaceae bacterium]